MLYLIYVYIYELFKTTHGGRTLKHKRSLWIAVTGLDGSGKTSLVENLKNMFEANGLSVYTDRLPHDQYIVKTLLDKSQDSYTDRLLFAVDNRLFGTELKEILSSEEYDIVLTQRCWLDSFVHGAVQGFSYSWISELNRISDLPQANILIHLVAESGIAYQRICNDPEADKFEYPEYMARQERETRRAYREIITGNTDLQWFFTANHIYLDTTQMTIQEVFEAVSAKLKF